MIVLLDTGLLGAVTNPSQSNPKTFECSQWLKKLLRKKYFVCVPEIAYYEVRRELLLQNKTLSIQRLEEFIDSPGIGYAAITTEIIVKATELWAWAWRTGQQTSSYDSLDGDVILAATAVVMAQESGIPVIIATPNVKHLARYTPAKHWKDIIV